jgi:hypothetical protein
VVGRRDDDGIDVLAIEHFPVIDVGGNAAVVLAFEVGVLLFNLRLGVFTAGGVDVADGQDLSRLVAPERPRVPMNPMVRRSLGGATVSVPRAEAEMMVGAAMASALTFMKLRRVTDVRSSMKNS